MLSFCAEPQGGVAESMIQPFLALRERGDPSQTVGEGLESVCFNPSSALTGNFSLVEKVFLRFASIGFCNSGQGCPSCRMTFWKPENSFLGVCNLMQMYAAYMSKSGNSEHDVIGNVFPLNLVIVGCKGR